MFQLDVETSVICVYYNVVKGRNAAHGISFEVKIMKRIGMRYISRRILREYTSVCGLSHRVSRISDALLCRVVSSSPTCMHVGFPALRISDASVSCGHIASPMRPSSCGSVASPMRPSSCGIFASEMRRVLSPTQGVGYRRLTTRYARVGDAQEDGWFRTTDYRSSCGSCALRSAGSRRRSPGIRDVPAGW